MLSQFRFLQISFILLALASAAAAGSGPCGVYFQPGYRAVNKITRPTPSHEFARLDDWTGDGRSDFWHLRTNSSTSLQDFVIYPALPAGYWDWNNPIVLTTPYSSPDSSVGSLIDYNSDGKTDVVNQGSGINRTVRVMLNSGSALTNGPINNLPTDSDTFLKYTAFRDMSGDGIVDIVFVLEEDSNDHQTLFWAAGNADGSFGTPVMILDETPANEFNDSKRIVGDVDGDGKRDIVYISDTVPARARVLRNMGGGTFSLGSPLTLPGREYLTPADINNDGRMDFVDASDTSFSVLYGQSDATLLVSSYSKTLTTAGFRTVDFNGDGRRDLVFLTNQTYEIQTSNADGSFTGQLYQRDFASLASITFEDFNADGKADLFEGGARVFTPFNEEVVWIKTNICSPPQNDPKAPNFNGWVIADLMTWNGSNGQWQTGDGLFNGIAPTITSFNWGNGSLGDVPAPGDFDGDGKTDYAVYRNSEGNWYGYLSATGSWLVLNFGLPGDIPIPGDYNGGGKTDIAVFRPSDGNWYIWFMENGSFAIHHWGLNGDRPMPADYDGDGKTDLGVFRPSEANWYYYRSSDQSYAVVHWGISTDKPLPGDYDGDGKADIAVYREGTWYVLRSTNGVMGVFNWGNSTDVPVPYMRTGNVSFPTIYRASEGRWHFYQNGPGLSILLAGNPVYYGLPNN